MTMRSQWTRRWREMDSNCRSLVERALPSVGVRLDHLPLLRDHLERLGDILAQLGQPRAATAKTNSPARLDHPLTPQMLGEGAGAQDACG
jgi:hypothetical protein